MFTNLDDFQNTIHANKPIVEAKESLKPSIIACQTIIGYGAPAKATTALNFYGVSDEIDFIVEDNKLKQGKLLPGVQIPIVSKEKLNNKKVDFLLVLAWNFFKEIKEKNKNVSKNFVSIKDLEKENFKLY